MVEPTEPVPITAMFVVEEEGEGWDDSDMAGVVEKEKWDDWGSVLREVCLSVDDSVDIRFDAVRDIGGFREESVENLEVCDGPWATSS